MDILKAIKKIALAVIILFFVSQINAQSGSGLTDGSGDNVKSAFKESYGFETNGQIVSAIDAMNKVYDKNSYEINLRLGWLNYLNKQYSESINYYRTAAGIMPMSVEARLGMANPVTATEDWKTLESVYQDILTIDPNNSQVNYKLGMIYYYRPDYNNAFRHFEKSVNMYPFDYYSVLMLAWTNFNLGKAREAEVLFNKVLLIVPDDASALEGLGLLKK
jgi:tetratricopeptide (TPR) repeat protein